MKTVAWNVALTALIALVALAALEAWLRCAIPPMHEGGSTSIRRSRSA